MSEQQKWKILTISDHPLVSSGVGTQTKYIIEGLLRTGKYKIRSIGGAIRHQDYRPQKIAEHGEDGWIIFPVDGYGDENIIREIIEVEKPDAIWFMTDPRFFQWLVAMSDEIRDRNIPLLYYHVWDNYPVPHFNKDFYASCDFIGCISQLTHDIVQQLGMKEHSEYIPHAVNADIFKPFPKEEALKKKAEAMPKQKDKFVVFYNSRNARRKMTPDVMKVFKMFLNKVGQDKGFLLMHTDPHDHEGANLFEVAKLLGLTPDQIAFSNQRVPPEQMAIFYNISDVTMNISNNEGFGLSCLESLSCGTPVIVNETGGLQDQAKDDEGNIFGACVKPASRSMTGSQQIPYIFDDRNSDEDLVDALVKLYNMTYDERKALGLKARAWTEKRFAMKDLIGKWDAALTKYITLFKEKGYSGRIRFTRI